MDINKCALCDLELTSDNNSSEHIIPNAIGGRKKVRGYICINCNNLTGRKWDSELANQLNPLSLYFRISRERGNAPSQIFKASSGNNYKVNHDGSMEYAKPEYVETKTDSKMNICIKAGTYDVAKKMICGAKKKYPQINLEETLASLTENTSYLNEALHYSLSIGGEKPGKSIVKSVLSLIIGAGESPAVCEEAINYLTNNGEACFGYYYKSDLIMERPKGVPFHCVFIKGEPKNKLIIGYIEFFGCFRIVLRLSNKYTGKRFKNSYSVNPITGEKLNLKVKMNLSSQEIEAAYNYNKIPDGSMEEAFKTVITAGAHHAYNNEMHRVIDGAVKHAFSNSNVKAGEIMTEMQFNHFNSLLWEKVEPFVIANLRKRK